MTAMITKPRHAEQAARGFGTRTLYAAITQPGAYVCNWSGHLPRVPEDSIKPGRSPLMSISAGERLLVTKISDDPFITVMKARGLAADCDLNVEF